MDVYGLGTLAMDVLIKVDRLPGADSFCIVKESERQPGGSGTNVIVQLARLGAECGYIAATGDDDIGKDILANLCSEKVNTSKMISKSGKTTLHTDIVIDDNGEKFILLNMGDAFGELKPDEVDLSAALQAKVIYTDLMPFDPAFYLLKAAKKEGKRTVFNMQVGLSTMEGMGITKKDIFAALNYVDVFAPCQEGMFDLTGTSNLDEAVAILRKYCSGILLFTRGKRGAEAYDEQDQKFHADCITVDAVDTTGAGDSYMGAFIFAYYFKGYDLKKAMRFASVCAGYTCTGLGARFSPNIQLANKLFSDTEQ